MRGLLGPPRTLPGVPQPSPGRRGAALGCLPLRHNAEQPGPGLESLSGPRVTWGPKLGCRLAVFGGSPSLQAVPEPLLGRLGCSGPPLEGNPAR